MPKRTSTVIPSGNGEAYWVVGDHITLKLGAAQSDDQFTFAETITAPGVGPPPHVHSREDEMFYIIEGQFGFVFDQNTSTGGPGDMVYLPKGIVHTFKNIGQTPGKLLITVAPSGFENFVPAAGCPSTGPFTAPPPVDEAAIGKLMGACARYGMEIRMDYKPGPLAPPRPAAKEYWVMGNHVRVMLGSGQTGGKFTVAEVTCATGTGVPPHTHLAMDEFFYVTRGTFEFELDGRRISAPVGTTIHVPAGQLHGFHPVGHDPAMLIDYHSPGGFEKFFEEAGVPCTDRACPPKAAPPDMPRLIALFERHGMTIGV